MLGTRLQHLAVLGFGGLLNEFAIGHVGERLRPPRGDELLRVGIRTGDHPSLPGRSVLHYIASFHCGNISRYRIDRLCYGGVEFGSSETPRHPRLAGFRLRAAAARMLREPCYTGAQ